MCLHICFYIYKFLFLLLTLLKIKFEKVKAKKRGVFCYLSYILNQTAKSLQNPSKPDSEAATRSALFKEVFVKMCLRPAT